jgi:flagellar hook-basal body complex protein FliE
MSPFGRSRSVITVLMTTLLTAIASGCGDDPPSKEIQQAQQAIDTARTAGADRYAADEFSGAQSALTRAQASVAAKDYRQALNDALDARDRAQTAANDAGEKKAATKTAVDRSLHDVALSLVDARAKLRTAEARRSARTLIPVRRALGDAETHVQEARTAFDNGEYLDAQALLETTRTKLDESVRILESAGRK